MIKNIIFKGFKSRIHPKTKFRQCLCITAKVNAKSQDGTAICGMDRDNISKTIKNAIKGALL